MDDTGASLEVSKAATATRKRRSSILKNQRPPRTPFSELEFNIATPTDTAKSRRVSFSKRTGVAEFVTNEATTTWKNFYEEHNKSLETSGNEPAAPRQVIEHIGKRIFDQQFEEIEVVDIGGTLQSNTRDCQNNGNLTLDSANKLSAHVQNFELSLMTENQTRVFGGELSIPTMNEMSNPININFSNLSTLGGKCDDLEEIERDLERAKNVVCTGPFNGRDMSEYIEIDLNMTHVVGKNDCDMSITEPIKSPNIQAVSKSENFNNDKKTNEDFTVDKENIIINPYVTPKETLNFASNSADDKILVFDGKKLTVQSERQPIPDVDEKNKYYNLLPNSTDTTPQRKTIFLNVNDDLPNFIQEPITSANNEDNIKQTTVYNDCDLSITQVVTNNIDIQKRKTIVFDEGADISITQAIPAKVLINKQKSEIIMCDNDDDNNISITQTVPTNIIKNKNDKQRTIVYEDDNISFTQAIPANLIMNDENQTVQDKTLLYQNDISITLGIPQNIIKNIEINNDDNISMTQAIPSNIITNEQTVYDNSDVNETLAVKNNIDTNESDKRRTVYENNLSFTQAIPDVMLDELKNKIEFTKTPKRLTIYDNDISMTQAMPSNIIQSLVTSENLNIINNKEKPISSALPTNLLVNINQKHVDPNTNNSILEKNIDKITNAIKAKTLEDSYNVSSLSMTKPIPSDIIDLQTEILKKINKSLMNPNKNECIKENNREVLVYQTNQTITTSKLKDIGKEGINDIVDKNVADEIKKQICKSEIEVENNDYKEEIDVVNKSLPKSKSLSVAKKSDIPKGNNKISILNELLDMSGSSLENVADSDEVSFKRDSVGMLEDEKVFNTSENLREIISKHPVLDYKDSEEVHNLITPNEKHTDTQKKLVSDNRHCETITSSDLQQSLDNSNISKSNKKSNLKGNTSFKDADNTNELLEILSHLTDGPTKELEKSIAKEIQTHPAIENKIVPKRSSFAQNRLSIVLSREDLLNNISMAQAALQQSRFEIDDDSIEETLDTLEDVTDIESSRKSTRMSNEVVKTLQFDEDESFNINKSESEINISPLKKTAFDKTSYTKDSIAKVIPTYLKDVSDNIKALMSDLVKPIDALPFDTGNYDNSLRKSHSTCTLLHTNLTTSSQTDFDAELESNEESLYNVNPSDTMTKEISSMGNRAIAEALRNSIMKPISANVSIETNTELAPYFIKPTRKSVNGPVLVFDPTNPLNNVLLSQLDNSKVHKYNPILSTDSKCESSTLDKRNPSVSTYYETDCKDQTRDREVNTVIIMKETKDILKENSALTLVDKDFSQNEIFKIDIKTSPIISMYNVESSFRVIYQKEHEEDTLEKMDSDFASLDDSEADENVKPQKRTYCVYSPTKLDKNKTIAPNVELTPKPVSKMQKISNSPQINYVVSPEKKEVKKSPKNKISPQKLKPRTLAVQKLLTKQTTQNNTYEETKETVNKHTTQNNTHEETKETVNKHTTKNDTYEETKETVKKHTTQNNTYEETKETVNKQPPPAPSMFDFDIIEETTCGLRPLDKISSKASSGGTRGMRDVSSFGSLPATAVTSHVSRTNWLPEALDEQSYKNSDERCHSGANVVAKINTLPFMGTRDCEWESSTGDAWTFRLLRSRIRIVVRLAPAHQDAVTGDAAVLSVAVESVGREERDPLARLAVRLACRAMRHAAGAGAGAARWSRADGVPALLERCWSLGRLTLRWAGALRDARARLAIAVGDEGDVSLKVANLSLRSVWEVRMRIELVAERGEEAWPRVTDARAVPVLSDGGASPALDPLVRLLPRNWGHAPAAVWKIFKYLKNKTKDDDICLRVC